MPIPVLIPRWLKSEPVLPGRLLRLLVPVSLRWPTTLTWPMTKPMTKVTTSPPEADGTSRQFSMLNRPEPLVLLVPPPPSTLVLLVPPPPSPLVPLVPLVVPRTLVTAVQQRIMIPRGRLARA
jgi:hypothetical protein